MNRAPIEYRDDAIAFAMEFQGASTQFLENGTTGAMDLMRGLDA